MVENLFMLFILNLVIWLLLHFLISALCFYMPLSYFLRDSPIFRLAKWEQGGKLWDQLFRVKRWKKHLIDGSSIVKKSYNKSHLHGTDVESLRVFSAETKRAELTHWLLLVPAPLFFIWNPHWAAWINVIYAIVANVPFIITQRFNRGRLEAIIYVMNMKKSKLIGK